jgi:CHAT domain-containing protein
MTGEHLQFKDLERLASIPGRTLEPEDTSLSDLKNHMGQCADCSRLFDAYSTLRQVQPPVRQEGLADCPADEEWFELAVGVCSKERSGALLAHVQDCAGCAETLKAALRDLDSSIEEEEVRALKSATPEWQEKIAGRMIRESVPATAPRTSKEAWWKTLFSGPVPALVFCTLLVAFVGIWAWRRSPQAPPVAINSTTSSTTPQETDDSLLASAYDQQRRTALHLSGGEPVALHSDTRGTSDTEDSLPLLKLRERTQTQLAQNHNDPYWLQMQGRVALLEGRGDIASKKFRAVQAYGDSSPGLLLDIGAAYFEIGEAAARKKEFLTAADYFTKVIDHPSATEQQKAAAFFNRALSYDQASVYKSAVEDYETALKLEKDAEWQAEIRTYLDKAQEKLRKSEGDGISGLDMSPAGFLAALSATPDSVDDDYEFYFDSASRDWLTHINGQSETAIRRLAEIGLTHHDAWLQDIEESDGTAAGLRQAFQFLASGLEANQLGYADEALSALSQADELFRAARNSPGELRARVELLYTLQRLGRSDDCMRVAASLSGDRQLMRYGWLNAYEVLESGICEASRGDSKTYLHSIQQALDISTQDRFPIEVLREQGMLVEILDSAGQSKEARRIVAEKLDACAAGAVCSPMRVYQFLQSLYNLTAEGNLPGAAAGVARSAAHFAALTPNRQIRGYAQEVLGVAETEAGHTGPAAQAFSSATGILKGMPEGDAENLYHADWETDRSVLLARQGSLAAAIQNMQEAGTKIARTDNLDVKQRYNAEMANLQLDSGNAARAFPFALTAVGDAERALRATQAEAGKLNWEKTYSRGYRLLVESLIGMGRPVESLQAWEWYHSAPYRSAQPAQSDRSPAFYRASVAIDPSRREIDLFVIVARLENYMVIWSISAAPGSSIRVARLPVSPDRLAQTAQVFAELCSDPNSPQSSIDFLGSQLYRDIFSSIDDQVRSASHIALETDATLQLLPFAALVTTDHCYFGDAHTLSMLPAWWTLRPAGSHELTSTAHALVVEGYPTLPSSGSHPANTIPPEYLEFDAVAAHFQHALSLNPEQATVAVLRLHLPEADVFHFSGHSFDEDGESGLLLRPGILFTASDLRGISLRKNKLVVLATCSSAGTADLGLENTSNLTHAMLMAGAANVVATLWDVDAKASRSIMLDLYEALSHSAPIPDAVRIAQQRLRNDPATRHPFFWSSVQDFTQ